MGGVALRVEVNPAVLAWAKARSRADDQRLALRFPKLGAWERGELAPTLNQLEDFARATHTPLGQLLLDVPPLEEVPIPDYRTIGDSGVVQPSADLLDTLFHCIERQDWYRSFAQINQEPPVALVGALDRSMPVVDAASAMRRLLAFDVDDRGSTFTDALRLLLHGAESAGVLVMVNGVVGSDTHRKLDPREFRGFALVDRHAPLVFVNGADTKAAQIFTLVHELVHICVAETALSDADMAVTAPVDIERWCNEVAAEFLVPIARMRAAFDDGADLTEELDRLARAFKGSTLVVLRRVYDLGHLGWHDYRAAYQAELARVLELLGERASSGGNFYNTQPVRVSKRFARAVVTSTLEGETLYGEAFRLLGFRKMSTFQELATRLGVE
jgi:Zn-dependent peptidase ImmA (M78 family)